MFEPNKLPPEVERLYTEMKAAREDWMRACAERKDAIALFRDLNLTHASTDGDLSLKKARAHESEALKKYIAAVDLYGDAVLRAGGVIPPESPAQST